MHKLALLFLFSASAFAESVGEIEFRHWFAQSDHKLNLDGFGPDIHLKSDLGIDKDKIPGVRLEYRSTGGSSHFVDFFTIKQSGDKVVNRTIDFKGQTYTVGTRVQSDLKTKNLRYGYAYRFGSDKFRIGPGVVVSAVFLDGTLAAPALSRTSKGDIQLPMPLVGLSFFSTPHERVSFSGNFGGIKLGQYGSGTDGEIQGRVYPHKNVSFGVGYRSLRYAPEVDNKSAVLRFKGAFFSAGVRF